MERAAISVAVGCSTTLEQRLLLLLFLLLLPPRRRSRPLQLARELGQQQRPQCPRWFGSCKSPLLVVAAVSEFLVLAILLLQNLRSIEDGLRNDIERDMMKMGKCKMPLIFGRRTRMQSRTFCHDMWHLFFQKHWRYFHDNSGRPVSFLFHMPTLFRHHDFKRTLDVWIHRYWSLPDILRGHIIRH